ncbi:MAG: hypothetical protein Q8K92_02150, partial [Leadbetterella sp.]|nr:hypothetical protein [Leadbetterella sp.]
LKKKYENYLDSKSKPTIKICFDEEEDDGDLQIGDKKFNYNTLEPKLLKVNNLKTMAAILGTYHTNVDGLHKYMRSNKTECALKIFDTERKIVFPKYILDAIE